MRIRDDGEDGPPRGFCYPWDQDTWGIAGPVDDVFLEDVEQRFIIVVKVQPKLAAAHAKLFPHVFGLLNHALGQHRQNKESKRRTRY